MQGTGPGSDGGASSTFDAGPLWDGAVTNASCKPAGSVWENASPPASNYANTTTGITSVVVRPDNPAVVIVGADSKGIFRSTDCGATWALASTGRNADLMASGRPWSMALDPRAPDVMYTVEGYGAGGLFKTTNGGMDWDQVLPDDILNAFSYKGQIDSVNIDPSDHTHLLVESHGSNGATGVCATQTCLAESKDEGATWTLISIPTAWGENSGVVMLSRTTWLYCSLFGGLFRTTDEGMSWKPVSMPSGAQTSCNVYNPYLYQDSSGSYYMPSLQGGVLKSAPQDSSTWSFIPNSPKGTTLLPTSTNLVVSNQFQLGYSIAPQSNAGSWTNLPTPVGPSSDHGGIYLAYDSLHHILYSANFAGGLWQIGAD